LGALDRLSASRPIECYIYGSQFAGPYLNKIYKLVTKLPQNIKIVFDQTSNPMPVYPHVDAVVFPAIRHHSSRTIIEAMSYGVPVIASDFTCTREFIEKSQGGFLFPAGDAQKLSEFLEQLMNESVWKDLSQKAYHFALENFDAKVGSQKVMSLYRTMQDRPAF